MEDQDQNTAADENRGERIAKRLARAGVCSRRDAERWIAEGRVMLNGKILETPAVLVTDADKIIVDGRSIGAAPATRLWRYHKPAGLVTSHRDEQDRDTIFQHLPREMPRVISVGRLDLNSEGLLLLTNDGGLSRHLELPATGWSRQYRVRAFGSVGEGMIKLLAKGITIEGVHYGPIKLEVERQQGSNVWLHMTLHEGKNREIRRVLSRFGLEVNRLIRESYGPFHLSKLAPGQVEEVTPEALDNALGKFLQK
ncbi:MAG: pseudouridine synthase [Alphaproteobacteria bacterium]|nr:pseudouridine synthase [Alphaproteobacteria bacterium]